MGDNNVECRNRVLSAAERAADAPALAALVAELRAPPLTEREPVPPDRAARLLLGLELDPFLVASIVRTYARTFEGDGPGYVYVFADAAEADARVLKIGRTRNAPDERLSQWRAELGLDRRRRRALDGARVYVADADGVESTTPRLTQLFAYPSAAAALAEAVVHTVLYCERVRGRVNRRRQRELVEYFRAGADLAALKLLVQAVTRHVTYVVQARARAVAASRV
jgi:hypothetical protein